MKGKNERSIRILLVDDEPDFREILGLSFKRLGYQTFFASNGNEAFNIIKNTPVDVVISDILMPGGTGIELLDRVKELRPDTPIVLLVTGFSELSTEEAHNKGAEALISKPFDMKTIHETIGRLLTPIEERWTIASDRIDVELKVELQFAGLKEAIESKVVRIGRGGIFVTTSEDQYPNINDTVSFKIIFGAPKNLLSGNGVVRWVRTKNSPNFPAGCGIEFTYLGDSERQLVLDFITSKQPKAFIPSS